MSIIAELMMAQTSGGTPIPGNSADLSGSNQYFTFTPSTTSDNQVFTYSTLLKRSSVGTSGIFATYSGYQFYIEFSSSNAIDIQVGTGGGVAGAYLTTNTFSDITNWYHLVLGVDTTRTTATDRLRLYINGYEQTTWAVESDPAQNTTLNVNTSSIQHRLGDRYDVDYFNGLIYNPMMVTGAQLQAADFGYFDVSDWVYTGTPTGETVLWELDFSASGDLGNDVSGNNNDWTPVNSPTQSLTVPINGICSGTIS